MMRQYAPVQFKALADFLVKNYEESGVSVEYLVKQRMEREKLSYADAYEEVIADSCESFLTDIALSEKAWQLYKESPETANAFKRCFRQYVVTPHL